MVCARCKKEVTSFIMSMFNTDVICLECKDKETKHPRYKEAQEAERKAVLNGNFNFPGIGLPNDFES